MWRVASGVGCALFTFVLTAFFLAACDPGLEWKYYKEGIGTELTTQNVPSAADLQDVYLNELCRQAGGAQMASANSAPVLACQWRLVTLAGLNDIDQRCDAYLAWLDDKRRSREPILSEIAAISAATTAILKTTGVGVNPITLVGIAFGLASNTFTNIRSRLLLEADNTTVQSIVMSRQKDFRSTFPQSINTRAEAIYVMRSYLRICMPMTIEMNINSTVAIFEQAGSSALGRTEPLTTPKMGGAPLTAQQQLTKPARPSLPSEPAYKNFILNYRPDIHSISKIEPILVKLCVTKAEPITKKFNALIKVFQQSEGHKVTGMLTDRELDFLNEENDCDQNVARNYYEMKLMPNGINNSDTIALLNIVLADPKLPTAPPASIADVRKRIPDARKALNASLEIPGDFISDQFTRDFFDALVKRKMFPSSPGTR
jgi:hypothetical protein